MALNALWEETWHISNFSLYTFYLTELEKNKINPKQIDTVSNQEKAEMKAN